MRKTSLLFLIGLIFSFFCLFYLVSSKAKSNQQTVELFNLIGTEKLIGAEKARSSVSLAGVREQEIGINLDAINFETAQNLRFPLLDGKTYQAIRRGSEGFARFADGGVTWRGKIFGDNAWSGDVILTAKGKALSGLIYSPGGVYEIVPQENFTHLLIQIDQSLFPPCGGSIPAKPKSENKEENTKPLPGAQIAFDNGSQIDVMVVYTAPVRSALGGTTQTQAFIQQAIASTNMSYQNSNINPRLRLVNTLEVNYTEDGSLSSALHWVSNDATVAAARNTSKADLVAILIEEDDDGCGVAYGMSDVGPEFADLAFSATKRSCAVGNLTFAHELGHNQGCEHNPENGSPPSSASYPYAFGHYVNGSFRTVMSYSDPCPSGCSRVAHFSNPSVTFNGIPTGITNERDNHRVINNTALIISQFRDSGGGSYTISVSASPSAGGTVSGGGTFAAGSSRTVTASANNGYTFTNWTEDGSVVSSSSSYSFTLNSNRSLIANFTSVSTGNAVYDSTLKAPKCGQPGVYCDSGTLLNGRDTITGGPEPNQPNTIYNSCPDNTSGSYHFDESIDRIKIYTLDGSNFAPGKTVRIEATVWVFSVTDDYLDLFYAADATNPNWTYIGTVVPSGTGAQVLSATYTLPSGGNLQAVRANFLYQGGVAPCSGGAGNYDDHDDLIFATSSQLAQITSPANNSTFGSSTTTFTWTPVAGATQYFLDLNSSPGSRDIYADYVSGGTTTVSGIPTDGRTVYVRLWSYTGGAWLYNNYTYTACNGCGGVNSNIAQITSPANGSTFPSSTVTFTWNPVAGATQYFLDLNSSPGSRDIYADYVSGGSTTVSGIPNDGRTIYVRMWSYIGGVWLYNGYTYKACSGCGGVNPNIAQVTSPANGSTFTSSMVTFTWNPVAGASQYFLDLNSSPGSRDIYADYVIGGSTTISGIPSDGRTIYVRIWTNIGGTWLYNSYTYKACNGCPGNNSSISQITSPANNSTFTSSTVTFTWNPIAGASQYYLDLNSSPGSRDIFANYVSGGSTTVFGIPTDGRTIYVRMWTNMGGVWLYNTYTYTARH